MHFDAAQVNGQFSRHFVFGRIAAANHHRRPSQTGYAFRITKQAREALHLALHVLRTSFNNQLIGALAGNDFGCAFSKVSARTQHTHGMVVRQQYVFDRLAGDLPDARNQVLRHGRRGRGVADHDEFVTDDHSRVWVTFGGVSPAMVAQLLEGNGFIRQI